VSRRQADAGSSDTTPHGRRPYALASFFGLVGFLPANWLVRVPDVKEQVGASDSELGLALLSGSLGSLAALLVAGRLCLRLGPRRVLVPASALLSLLITLPGVAPSLHSLALALVLVGMAQATFTIAVNSSAVEMAAASGSPLMPTLHGVFSVGGLAGAAVGGVVAERMSPGAHLGIVGVLGLLVTAVAGPPLLRSALASGPADPRSSATPDSIPWARARWIVLLFGVIAACTAFAEFTNNNWATLHVRRDLGTSASVAAYCYACYAGAIAVGRFLGARLIRRLGETRVLCGGFLLAAVATVLTSWAGHLPGGLAVAFVAYVALGLGLANIYPIAISRAGVLGGPRGVSRIGVAANLGALSQAPLIGFLADRYGLPTALTTVAVLSVSAATLAFGLRAWSSGTRPRTPLADRPSSPGPAATRPSATDAASGLSGDPADVSSSAEKLQG
jgi:predicted MFS family arabinose efflux permease